jgi:hypothetical protein
MRAKLLGLVAILTLALPLTLAGSALAAGHAAGHAVRTGHHTAAARHFVTGEQRFEVYATQFEASFAPIYFTGPLTTAGIGYKHIAEFQDQAFLPKGNGTFIIYHPGLSQTQGVTTTLDPKTCVLTIAGSGPAYFIDGTGGFLGISGKGRVALDIRVFLRPAANGGCDQAEPPWGYIEIAKGDLDASIPAAVATLR